MNKIKFSYAIFLILLMLLIISACELFSPADIKVRPATDRIGLYQTLYTDIRLRQPFENPYDPAAIRVDMVIAPPDGDTLVLPCFYCAGPSQNSLWEARFTAMQSGAYSYRIYVITAQDTSVSKPYRLEVENSEADGFLHLNPFSNYSFRFDSGKRFRGVGMNLGWEMQSQWPHSYETYFEVLAANNANFIRTWMCPWNLPLEWTRVLNYETFVDELENWAKTYSHSDGLALTTEKTPYTEDDTNRVTIRSDSRSKIVYHLENIRRFKIKLFYHKQLSRERIKCYSSADNKTYSPIDIEFSQTWNTHGDWQRIFIAYIDDLPEGVNYLKLEFLEQLTGAPQLANVLIEHGAPQDILDAPGLGRYYQKTAERLDQILQLAEEKGIYIMLALDYHGIFKSYIDRWASNAEWRTNPYNAANGGPCATPADFFTNAEARRFYKNRLRYMVARWGYSTRLAVWEFWNEIDNVMEWQQVPPAAIAEWHREMANYLKSIDPYGHLVSTSVSNREVPGLWTIAKLDFTQHHNYGPTANMKASIQKYIDRFKKPDVVGEFALGWKGPGKDYPAQLYEGEMHNGIWRGMFSPTPILPMTWWWEWHYSQNHYFHFKQAAGFVALMLTDDQTVLEELPVRCLSADLEVLGLRSGRELFVWLRNWHKETLKNLTIYIPGTGNTTYQLQYYDTWTGDFSSESVVKSESNCLTLNNVMMDSECDMALWLKPQE